MPKLRILWVLLLSVSPTFAADKPIAIVNGEPIPRSEFEAAKNMRPQAVVPLTISQQKQIDQEIIAALVDEALMRQFLSKNAPPIDQAQMNKELESLLAGLKSQGKTLADYCKESMQSEKQLRANLALMQQWIAYSANKVTDENLKKFYADNKDFFDKNTVRASHIVIRVSPTAPSAEKSAVTAKLRDIRQEIAAGKITFADAATKHSQCPSAPKGGDLGFIARKFMVDEPIARAAFSLKVNEISDVVASEYGLHILIATERKAGEGSEFDKIKADVKDFYVEELRQDTLNDLRKRAKIETSVR